MVHSDETLDEKSKQERMSSNVDASFLINSDTDFVKSKLINKYAFFLKENIFFKFVGTHWEPIQPFQIQMENAVMEIILENANEILCSIKPSGIRAQCTYHLNRAKTYLIPPDN